MKPRGPDDMNHRELNDALAELYDMGFVEVVGINDDGEWLYASTEEGKRAARNWID